MELQKNASRYQVSSVLESNRAGSMLEKISKLVDSKTVNIVPVENGRNTFSFQACCSICNKQYSAQRI